MILVFPDDYTHNSKEWIPWVQFIRYHKKTFLFLLIYFTKLLLW